MKKTNSLIIVACILCAWTATSLSSGQAQQPQPAQPSRRQSFNAWAATVLQEQSSQSSLVSPSLANILKSDFFNQLSPRARRRASCPQLLKFLKEENAVHYASSTTAAQSLHEINSHDEEDHESSTVQSGANHAAASASATRPQHPLRKSRSCLVDQENPDASEKK